MSKQQSSTKAAPSPWLERVRALRNVPPVLRILWDSGPWVVTWGLILRLFVAVLPFGVAKVAQYILNDIAAVLHGQKLADNFWYLVGAEIGLNVVLGLLLRVMTIPTHCLLTGTRSW